MRGTLTVLHDLFFRCIPKQLRCVLALRTAAGFAASRLTGVTAFFLEAPQQQTATLSACLNPVRTAALPPLLCPSTPVPARCLWRASDWGYRSGTGGPQCPALGPSAFCRRQLRCRRRRQRSSVSCRQAARRFHGDICAVAVHCFAEYPRWFRDNDLPFGHRCMPWGFRLRDSRCAASPAGAVTVSSSQYAQ